MITSTQANFSKSTIMLRPSPIGRGEFQHHNQSALSSPAFGLKGIKINAPAADIITTMVTENNTNSHTLPVIKTALDAPRAGKFYIHIENDGRITVNNPETDDALVFADILFNKNFLNSTFLKYMKTSLKLLCPGNDDILETHFKETTISQLANKNRRQSQSEQLQEIISEHLDKNTPCCAANKVSKIYIPRSAYNICLFAKPPVELQTR